MSSWSGQLCGKEGYFLQFETKDYETYRRVEKFCQDIMDEENGRKPRKFHNFCSVCGKEELNEDLYIRDRKWICSDCDKKLHPEDYDDEEDVSNPLTGYYQPKFILEEDKVIDTTFIPETCRSCSNHPSNGGSGICNCTLGQYSINTIPRAPETICESKTVATNKITEQELKDFNLYKEIKQSLEDAIKFESKK